VDGDQTARLGACNWSAAAQRDQLGEAQWFPEREQFERFVLAAGESCHPGEQYARESVPRQFWSSPRFKQVNRQLTLMWALVFCAMIPSHLIAGAIDTRRANTIFNWLIPIILVVWAAKRTGSVSGAEGEKSRVR